MGQKVNPIGFRTGVYRDWNARWFARTSYGDMLLEDLKIRRYLDDVLKHAEISRVEIEKAGDNVKVIIHSARPGTVIGKKGQEIDSLRRGISKIIKKNSKTKIYISITLLRKLIMASCKNILMRMNSRQHKYE